MNSTQQKIISHLEQHGPLTSREVAQILDISLPKMRELLWDMTKKGMIQNLSDGKYSLRKEVVG